MPTVRRAQPLLATALACGALACASARPPATAKVEPPADVRFDPEEVRVSPLDLELNGKGDEELFAIGTEAYEAKDFTRSAAAFARIPDRFPGSRREPAALFNAGLAYEALREWRLALERFRALSRGWEGRDALEAEFKVAECQYQLRELGDAYATLRAVADRPGLAAPARVRALTQLGVIELEQGKPDDADVTLRSALAAWRALGDDDRLDPYYPAQAEYYRGEILRARFLALKLDPATGDDAGLQEALEGKSETLLAAQEHYLRSIRMGSDRWAVGAGARIGELYDAFRKELLEAELPPGLDDEGARAYRQELKKRVRVLAEKAVSAYRAALDRAMLSGVEDLELLGQAQAALQRLRDALRDDATGI